MIELSVAGIRIVGLAVTGCLIAGCIISCWALDQRDKANRRAEYWKNVARDVAQPTIETVKLVDEGGMDWDEEMGPEPDPDFYWGDGVGGYR